ncbi:MAG: hypothetical protein GY703_22260 [Gammaproteobacteria bacterium]|nr:hypothetical protein [Gammaproteobacteria bacterium]
MMRAIPFLIAVLMLSQPMAASAWEEQPVLEFILANNTLLRAYRTVTDQYTPPDDTVDRMLEYTSVYGRTGIGGTDFRDQPFILQAGIQINIPLASTKEKRAHAMKAVEETRTIDEIRAKVLGDIAQLRQHEADLAATRKRLKFYEDKSGWLQKRVKDGYDEVTELWNIGQKLNEERAASERLGILVSSQQYQVAHYAGDQWQILLAYLKGKGALE